MPELRLSTPRGLRGYLLLTLALLSALTAVWQLALFTADSSYVDGICTALGVAALPPPARALSLFRWVSTYDHRALPPETALAPGTHDFMTARSIVEHRAYFRDNCGSQALLLVILARHAGLEARELRLCSDDHIARHVVGEIEINGRWAVFDPMASLDFRRRDGQPATAADLRDPELLAANAARVRDYDLRRWRFDHAERLHFEKLPLLGGWLRRLAPRLTGRPAEELAPPPAMEQPRLLAGASLAALSLLALIGAARSFYWSRQRARVREFRTPFRWRLIDS